MPNGSGPEDWDYLSNAHYYYEYSTSFHGLGRCLSAIAGLLSQRRTLIASLVR